MISQTEIIKLLMNIDVGIGKCRGEMKQCAEDIEALKGELQDLLNMREIIEYQEQLSKN